MIEAGQQTDRTTANKANSAAAERPIIVHGSNNGARITALALAAAGFKPHISMTTAPNTDRVWQAVLALSPAAKTMLETLGVWQRLTQPTAPVCDISVFGSATAWRQNNGLSFAPAHNRSFVPSGDIEPAEETPEEISLLAHIVSLADLTMALDAALNDAIAADTIDNLAAPLTDFDRHSGAATLENGDTHEAALLIDCAANPAPWGRDMAALAHDYKMAALVGRVSTAKPHGQVATQLFLPEGPLALLPLPHGIEKTGKDDAPHQRALIWSLPRAKAEALAAVDPSLLDDALADATGGQVGAIKSQGPLAVQNLSLKLNQLYVDGHLCISGDGAHMVHPMAGQGFNLTLRDAAVLADCLYEARRVGLAADGPHILAEFVRQRRGDAAITGALTHMLATVFSGPAAKISGPLGRLGLQMTGTLAARRPQLAAALRAQADGRATATPRLMRGVQF